MIPEERNKTADSVSSLKQTRQPPLLQTHIPIQTPPKIPTLPPELSQRSKRPFKPSPLLSAFLPKPLATPTHPFTHSLSRTHSADFKNSSTSLVLIIRKRERERLMESLRVLSFLCMYILSTPRIQKKEKTDNRERVGGRWGYVYLGSSSGVGGDCIVLYCICLISKPIYMCMGSSAT